MRRPRLRSLIPGASKPVPTASSPEMPEGVMTKLRQLLIGMAQMGGQRSEERDVRKLIVGAAKMARKAGGMRQAIQNIADTEAAQVAEASTWMTPAEVAEGKSGRFDACDLRNWLAIAERAGVPAIPAREIASFTAEEYGQLVGKYGLDRDNPRIKRMFDAIREGIEADYTAEELDEAREAAREQEPTRDEFEVLAEKLYSAMDELPEGWMVRASTCGGDNLKALAGCGVTETFIPEVRFGADLEIGPGWVRSGNRRRIDIQDRRTMQLYVRNDTVPIAYLARPWVVASRWLEGNDPHRAGTPIDIPGTWPAEWRAFVRAGKVVGVSSYYSWAGRADAMSARMAIKVRELAQRIVDAAIASDQLPRSMDDALVRRNSPRHAKALEAMGFMDGDFDATIDFIESDALGAEDGLLMLEAGPGCGPFGSGHPCGFAGDYSTMTLDLEDGHGPQELRWMPCEGVALTNMEHILIGEPKTWETGDKQGRILSWQEADELASR